VQTRPHCQDDRLGYPDLHDLPDRKNPDQNLGKTISAESPFYPRDTQITRMFQIYIAMVAKKISTSL
jgi:hypothetical protein